MRTAADVHAMAERLYGTPFEPGPGVVQVVAVYQDDDAVRVLRVNNETPRSSWDAFALNLARARADAIVTSARILRDEPTLQHEFTGSATTRAAFEMWGRRVRGHDRARYSVVLTRGTGFPPDHPILGGPTRVIVMCPAAHAPALQSRFGEQAEIRGLDPAGLGPAIVAASEDLGARTVVVEAGPTLARSLYADADCPDELMLSEYLEKVPRRVRGERLMDRERLVACFGDVRCGKWAVEPDGAWRFAWLVRAPRGER